MAILQEVAIGNVTFWMLIGYTSVLLGIIATIAGFIKAFSTKANKKDVDDLKIEVNKKVENEDLIILENRFVNRMERFEIVNAEVIRSIKKDISEQRKETTELYKKIIEIVQSK